MEHEGFASPAADADGATTTQPERDLQADDPNVFGAAAPEEKKGIKDKVKGLMGRRHRKKDAQHPSGKIGKAKDKLAREIGYGEDGENHGPSSLMSSSSSSSMSSSDEEDIGTVGFALDPTGPPVAGRNLGRRDFTSAPAGPGADFSKIDLKPPVNAATRRHAKRAEEYAKWSTVKDSESENSHGDEQYQPPPSNSNLSRREDANYGGVNHSQAATLNLNPSENAYGGSHSVKQTATDDGERLSSTPPGMTNSMSEAVVGDQHEGPRGGNAKPEGFMSKVMDTFRSPKGESAATSTTSNV